MCMDIWVYEFMPINIYFGRNVYKYMYTHHIIIIIIMIIIIIIIIIMNFI